ncbi:Cofilin [Talaromyces pinophilus]|nr:Cofilin [Talaromyces pinophilus]
MSRTRQYNPSNSSSVTIDDECITKFNDFRMSRGKTKFVIYKITDDKKRVVVEDVSEDADWEVFRTKLADAKDAAGNPAPRYATYDVQYEIPGEGQRSKIIFISWVPQDTPTRLSMLYASTREVLKNAVNVAQSIHADDKSDIEWKSVLAEVSKGKGQ